MVGLVEGGIDERDDRALGIIVVLPRWTRARVFDGPLREVESHVSDVKARDPLQGLRRTLRDRGDVVERGLLVADEAGGPELDADLDLVFEDLDLDVPVPVAAVTTLELHD